MPEVRESGSAEKTIVAVIGAGGRLGAAVARRLAADESGRFSVRPLSRADMDLADTRAIKRGLDAMSPRLVINTAALTNVDYCEEHPDEAFAVNAAGPAVLAGWCRRNCARFLHVSTDYVYSGREPGLRTEDDPAEPLGRYGESKLEGERAALAENGASLVVRTSWVFGPDRPSFIDMILERARNHESVAAISDKVSAPCFSEDFARWSIALLDAHQARGVVNLCNSGACTWQEYAQAALDAALEAGMPLKAKRVDGIPLSSMDRFVAPRPVFTAMSVRKFELLTGILPRPWQEAVREYVHTRSRRA